jgi:hypothetical protein
MRLIFFVLTACIVIEGCTSKKKDYGDIFKNSQLYSNTVHELNKVVMGNNFSPPVASRNYLYANIAAYEAIAAGYPNQYNSLAGQLNGLKNIPKPDNSKKINYEFTSLMAFCTLGESVTYPKGSMSTYVDSLKNLAKEHGMPDDVFNNSLQYADTLSKVIMAWSKEDNYLHMKGMPEYTVKMEDPSRWVPTPPAYSSALEPYWNTMRPLVLDSASQFRPPPPFKFNITDKNSPYYQQVIQIKNAIDSLTPEQKHMADFWDDNAFKVNLSGHLMFGTKKFSPPGHWMSIVGIAAKKANADYPETVYAFAKTAIALFDTFIQCWDAKYKYNTVRPETVINRSFDKNWQPYLQTPSFPEYSCGHCTLSSSAAEVLTSIFRDNFAYTDTSELEFGIKSRSYKSFRDAAEENDKARFYGGIHFYPTCALSTIYGAKVGDLIVDRLHMKKEK